MKTLIISSVGSDVERLQHALVKAGFNPGRIDGSFGPGTEAAVRAYQHSEGLLVDGQAGPRTLTSLGLGEPGGIASYIGHVSDSVVAQMFPSTPLRNIRENLPTVLEALDEFGLTGRSTVLMALATIRAETESFRPVREGISRYNTSPSGHDFDLYDSRKDLGNSGAPDGALFAGRGYVQLTGRSNYVRYGEAIGMAGRLVTNPDLACVPKVAGRLLAAFIKSKEMRMKQALAEGDLPLARKLVNGGRHGLDRFTEAYRTGDRLLPA